MSAQDVGQRRAKRFARLVADALQANQSALYGELANALRRGEHPSELVAVITSDGLVLADRREVVALVGKSEALSDLSRAPDEGNFWVFLTFGSMWATTQLPHFLDIAHA